MKKAEGAEYPLRGTWQAESGSRRLLQNPNPSQNVIEMMLGAHSCGRHCAGGCMLTEIK